MSTHNVLMNEWSSRFRGECWEHLGHRSVLTWRWSQSIRMINHRHIARAVKVAPLVVRQHLIAPAEALPCVVAQGRRSVIYSKSNTNRTISADWRSTALGKQSLRKICDLIYSEWLYLSRWLRIIGERRVLVYQLRLWFERKTDLFVTREQSSLERATRVYL